MATSSTSNLEQPAPPRVIWMRYRVSPSSGIWHWKFEPAFEKPFNVVGPTEPVDFENADFKVHVEVEVATVTMKTCCRTVDEARELVDPVLKAWEIEAVREHLCRHGDIVVPFRFDYESAEIEHPERRDVVAHVLPGKSYFLNEFPPFSGTGLAVEPARAMWDRFSGYLGGREPLQSMAYYCFTELRTTFGNVPTAAVELNVSQKVLRKLSELTSDHSDPTHPRKKLLPSRPSLTSAERLWLEQCLILLMERVAVHAYDVQTGGSLTSPQITLSDLPGLP